MQQLSSVDSHQVIPCVVNGYSAERLHRSATDGKVTPLFGWLNVLYMQISNTCLRPYAALLLFSLLLAGCSSTQHTPMPERVAIPQTSQQQQQVSSPIAHDILFRALGLVGIPYRWGGNTPQSGFDCSGLIGYVYRDVTGIALPRTTGEMSRMQAVNVSRDGLLAGDLVFFATDGHQRVSHVGIYVGEGRFIHAPSTGGTVRMDSLSNSYWQGNYLTAKRVLGGHQLALNP